MRKLLFLFTLLFSLQLAAEIIETDRFDRILDYDQAGTLFILDIDNTLITPKQVVGSDPWFRYRITWYQSQGYAMDEALERTLPEWEAVQNITESLAVEETIPMTVRSLQYKGRDVIGLTTRGLSLATRTVHQLQDVEIDLNVTALTHEEIPFFNPHTILFRKGILFTSGTHKGNALMKLLAHLDYKPEKVVFINDHASHLLQVEDSCEKEGISFIGLRYNYLDERVKSFRPDIADVQFEHFKRILSDQEAVNLIKIKGDKDG